MQHKEWLLFLSLGFDPTSYDEGPSCVRTGYEV